MCQVLSWFDVNANLLTSYWSISWSSQTSVKTFSDNIFADWPGHKDGKLLMHLLLTYSTCNILENLWI